MCGAFPISMLVAQLAEQRSPKPTPRAGRSGMGTPVRGPLLVRDALTVINHHAPLSSVAPTHTQQGQAVESDAQPHMWRGEAVATIRHNANGHRRRELTKRVLAEETLCALCDQPVDKTLTYTPGAHGPRCPGETCAGCIPHPMRYEIDEDIPRSRGGSPYERRNCRLMHRTHNQWKGAMTLTEARTKWAQEQHTKTIRTITPTISW